VAKKALCVGINDYPVAGMDLRGCVNDAHDWATLLVEHYDFPKADVKVVLDDEATHAAMISGLEDLLAGARSGDVLVFTNSSHGTYLADTDGDEPTYDEALCPYDTEDHPLVDDELRTLFTDLPRGVRLTVLADSCHSGTVTRALPTETPDQRRVRFMNPRAIGRPALDDPRRVPPRKEKHPQKDMKEVLLSGCRHNQYSYDATIAGAPHGAFTYHAVDEIRRAGYAISYAELRTRVVRALSDSNYDQEPQLEGAAANLRRQVFT